MLQTCASIGKENHTDEFKDQFQVTLELQIRFKGLFFPVCFYIMESYVLYKGQKGKEKQQSAMWTLMRSLLLAHSPSERYEIVK